MNLMKRKFLEKAEFTLTSPLFQGYFGSSLLKLTLAIFSSAVSTIKISWVFMEYNINLILTTNKRNQV